MNEIRKTVAFVAAAALMGGAAIFASIPRATSGEDFREVGRPFFPEFTDPAACTSLEVAEIDATTGAPRVFKVMQRSGRWVIPSHFDYPADAKDRLARTAAQVLGLTQDTIRSSRADDHAALGVLDPLDPKTPSYEGAGKRITLRDRSDRVLADYIIGKDVAGRPGQKFVRRPGQARTYGVNVKAEPSTRFADWIEPNLLTLDDATIRKLLIDSRKPQRAPGEPETGDVLSLTREASGAPWLLETPPSGEKKANAGKTSAMTRALADLKIVGVRPKPNGLAGYLAGTSERKGVDTAGMLSLRSSGFYLSERGVLIPEEGQVNVQCDDGVSLTLYFGKVTFARGEALSAGTGAEAESKEKDKDAAKSAPGDNAVESRYLFVNPFFDAKAVPKPAPPKAPVEGIPANVFQRTAAEARAEGDRERREQADYQKRLDAGRARVADLAKRFAPWYYLVPGDAYRTLMVDRPSLLREDAPAPGPGMGFPGGANFPRGPSGPLGPPH